MLNPQLIAESFELEYIDSRIKSILESIEAAEASIMDEFDDTQARQKTKRQKLSDLNDTLQVWLSAKSLKTGGSAGAATLIAGKYTGGCRI